jgi:hypothetical protein
MKVNIIHVAEFHKSVQQAKLCEISCKKYGYEVIMCEGVTPSTLKENDPGLKPMPNSRAWDYETEKQPYLQTKKSCFINHLQFWQKVEKSGQTQIFLEHDARALRRWDNPTFDGLLVLNMNAAFYNNKNLLKWHKGSYEYKGKGVTKIREMKSTLTYHKQNEWENSYLVPGTAAYAITPEQATKLIDIAFTKGWDQSDFFINSFNAHIQYADPEYFGFSGVNLNTSAGFK